MLHVCPPPISRVLNSVSKTLSVEIRLLHLLQSPLFSRGLPLPMCPQRTWRVHATKLLRTRLSQFGSVQLRFVHGPVRKVPVFGYDGSLRKGVPMRFWTV